MTMMLNGQDVETGATRWNISYISVRCFLLLAVRKRSLVFQQDIQCTFEWRFFLQHVDRHIEEPLLIQILEFYIFRFQTNVLILINKSLQYFKLFHKIHKIHRMFRRSVNPNQNHPESLHCCCGAASLGVDVEVSKAVLE